MPMNSRTIAAVLLASAAFAAPVSANTIGTVSALNQNVDGTPPQAATRELVIGEAPELADPEVADG